MLSGSVQHQNSSKKNFGAGFTLIETLVAITLLVLAVTGPLQIAANALFSAFHARDEITAYYLAVEGIEYIKNSRDSLFLSDVFEGGGSSSPWLNGFDVCITDGSDPDFRGCDIKSTFSYNVSNPSNSIIDCTEDTSGECDALNYNETTGFWGHDEIGGIPTKFKRKITIIPDSSGGNIDALVKVDIMWPAQSLLGGDKTYTLSTLMTNWERI